MFWALTALVLASDYFLCDDNIHACKKGKSCCPKDQGYSCCPLQEAICCADSSAHCCPLGYPICDLAHSQCVDHLQSSSPLLTKTPALKLLTNTQDETSFISGFAFGFSSQLSLEEFYNCLNESLISLYNVFSALSYMYGESELDSYIAIEKFGIAVEYLSQGYYSCGQAMSSGQDSLDELIDQFQDPNLVQILAKNFYQRNTYIRREWNLVENASNFERGKAYGKILGLLFQW